MCFTKARRVTAPDGGQCSRASRISVAAGVLILTVLGCSRTVAPESVTPPAGQDAEASVSQTDREIWEVCTIEGQRAGYGRTRITSQRYEGRDVLRIEIYNRLAVKRFGQEFQTELRCTSLETPDGRLIEFSSEIPQGSMPMRTEGKVLGDQLQLTITTEGKSFTSTIPWKDEYGGPYAVQLSLLAEPLTPGGQRTIRTIEVAANTLTANGLVAKDYEKVDLPDGPKDLLRIETTTTLAGQTLRGTIWADAEGEVWKNHMRAMNLEMVRTTEARALAESQPATFDLGLDVMVPVGRRLADPHGTRRIQYRVSLEGDDPAELFTSGPSQQVEKIDASTARVTVWAVRSASDSGNVNAAADPPDEGDRAANSLIQSDDPRIVDIARRAAADASDPWATVVALERYVEGYMTETNFSTGFATAAEVAQNKTGDCTEHAVLLAALIRAREIPARVAVGLVYYRQAYAYHMWTEAYVEGRWIALDATRGRGGIGAAHLKVSDSNLKGISPYNTFLPVLKMIGRLKIELEEVE